MAANQSSGGGGGGLLLVILAVVGSLGVWNYQRNLALEEQRSGGRPFESYADAELEALGEAYGEQAEILERKYRAALGRRTGVRESNGLIMEKIDEFDRVQKVGNSIREATAAAADAGARLQKIRDEQALRRDGSGWQLHLARLTNF